jgi:hypothetical protein
MHSFLVVLQFDEEPAHTKVACDSCAWQGIATDTVEPEEAWLTPGSTVPAGQCPECGALAYVIKP